MATDLELMTAWQRGDERAGAELCDRHLESLFRFFSSKVHPNDVSDLVQKTMLGVVQSASSFRADSNVRTYILSIARRQMYRHFRDRARDKDVDFGVSSIHDLDGSPSSLVAEREQQRLLHEALRRIPVELQIALELHFWEGLSGSQIADVLEVPEGTVRSRLRRGLEALRRRVEELASTPSLSRSTLDDVTTWERSLDAETK
jgi:RNA polymerase sigma-70 factor (ECF subfamily)